MFIENAAWTDENTQMDASDIRYLKTYTYAQTPKYIHIKERFSPNENMHHTMLDDLINQSSMHDT